MSFVNIIGNDNIKNDLKRQIVNNDILHSYMFVGQDGIGKHLFAKEFAKLILCLSDDKFEDESCESCVKFSGMNHPDFEEINPDGNHIKIIQIRELKEKIYQKPIVSKRKVFIINDADTMTEEAQNSLLKTLEEPPEYVVIILVLSNEGNILNTIKSRCMKINFHNLSDEELKQYITQNQLLSNTSDLVLKLCNGSIGKIEKIKDKLDLYSKTEEIIDGLIEKRITSKIDLIKQFEFLYKEKEDIQFILEYILILLSNKIIQDISKTGNCYNKYYDSIEIVKNTIIKVQTNANYDMTIDEFIFSLQDKLI